MRKTRGPIELLNSWCQEAVGEFGDNWPMIHCHIRKKLAELPEPERVFVMQNVQLVLAPLDYEPH
jgi:hypothetical protein